MSMMNAVCVHRFGGPEVLNYDRVPIPECGPDQVLVRVKAAGVGPWDAWVRSGNSVIEQPLPLTPGSDISGEVVAVGPNVAHLAIGTEVYGATNARFTNGYAEYALCEGAMLAEKPQSLTHVEAASIPVIAVTAWQMLFGHAQLASGESVLIHGAGGNVGRYAVQLARHAGVRVLATTLEYEEAVVELGASGIVDPKAPASLNVSAVIDLVGGDGQDALFAWLAPRGKLISAVREPDTALAMERGIHAKFILVDVRREILDRLSALFDSGALRPWIGATLPLHRAAAAHQMLAGDLPFAGGKIVLQPE